MMPGFPFWDEGIEFSRGNHVIFTPFVHLYLTEQSNSEAARFDLANAQLNYRFNLINDQELYWLLNQNNGTIFYNCETNESLVHRLLSNNKIEGCCFLFYDLECIKALNKSFFISSFVQYVPKSIKYFLDKDGVFIEGQRLENRLVYGMLDVDVEETKTRLLGQPEALLTMLTHEIKKSKKEVLKKLIVLLTYQGSSTVLFSELASNIGVDNETAKRYVMLLVQSRYVYCLPSFHTNQRYEFLKGNSIVFSDNGVLNAHGAGFNALEFRGDAEQLWKNWLIAERIKLDRETGETANYFFWQSHTGQRIDLLIFPREKMPSAYIFYWKKNPKKRLAPLFKRYYPSIPIYQITPSNYLNFLMP